MAKGLGQIAIAVAQPKPSVFWNVEFAIAISHHAMAARFVVIAETLHRAVVLGHVEINGPGSQRIGHFLQRFVEGFPALPVKFGRQQAGFRRVVAHGVEKRVGHVCLEADGLGPVSFFQSVDHGFPGMHAAPADFALGSQAFAEVCRNTAGFAKCLGNFFGVACGVFRPLAGA